MKTFRIITIGGIGDALLVTPLFREIKKRFPDSRTNVWCVSLQQMELLKNNPYIARLRHAKFWKHPLSFTLYKLRPARYRMTNYMNCLPGVVYTEHASRIIAEMFDIELTDAKPDIFLTGEEKAAGKNIVKSYSQPVTLHTTATCSKNKEWPLENWKDLVKQNPQYTFVQIGGSKDVPVEGAVDLRGRSLREQFSVMANSSAFVGIESLFAHASAALGVPGVVLFGPSTPVVWGHANNVNIYQGLNCSSCIDILGPKVCPFQLPCMTQITVERVSHALETVLSPKPEGLNICASEVEALSGSVG